MSFTFTPTAEYAASHDSGTSSPIKLRHTSSASTHSNSTSSSLDEGVSCQEPNELIVDNNQDTVAIEVPASTLRIDLGPFRPPGDVNAEPGDIIEFDRILSSHWAIYVGDGDVIHVSGGGSQEIPDLEEAVVQRAPMTVVAGENFCRVNNKLLRAKERNMLPFNNEIVVRKALSKVGSTVPYNALQCNAEHYVTEWKYGHRWSDQAAVSLNCISALRRQHTNSLSEGHALFVNTLNEVLNSPAVTCANSSSTSPLSMASNNNSASSSTFASLSSTPPRSACGIPIPANAFFSQNGSRYRQLSQDETVMMAGSLPKTIVAIGTPMMPKLTRTISSGASFATAGVQTEL